MSCDFCDLPQIKERIIVRNDLAWAFPTYIPITPGHTLVCPSRCVARFEDLSADELQAMQTLTDKIKRSLEKAFGAKGFNCAWNDGQAAGQKVPHLHLHVVPRAPGDQGVHGYEPREFLYRPGSRDITPEQELQEIANLIRSHLQ